MRQEEKFDAEIDNFQVEVWKFQCKFVQNDSDNQFEHKVWTHNVVFHGKFWELTILKFFNGKFWELSWNQSVQAKVPLPCRKSSQHEFVRKQKNSECPKQELLTENNLELLVVHVNVLAKRK